MDLLKMGLAVVSAGWKGVRWLWKHARASPEQEAFSRALSEAVHEVLHELRVHDADRLQAVLDRGEPALLLADVIKRPTTPADVPRLRAEVERLGYALDETHIDFGALIELIRDRFVAALPRLDAGRDAHTAARVEQTHEAVLHTRDLTIDVLRHVSRADAPGALDVIRQIYEDARAMPFCATGGGELVSQDRRLV